MHRGYIGDEMNHKQHILDQLRANSMLGPPKHYRQPHHESTLVYDVPPKGDSVLDSNYYVRDSYGKLIRAPHYGRDSQGNLIPIP